MVLREFYIEIKLDYVFSYVFSFFIIPCNVGVYGMRLLIPKPCIVTLGHNLVQRHVDDGSGHVFSSKSKVVLEEKLPLYHNKQNQRRFPPLYDQIPISDRLVKVEMLDSSITSKGRLNKPKPPDEQKSQTHAVRSFPKLLSSNNNDQKRHDKNGTVMETDDGKSDSVKSWRDTYHLSGVPRKQIPSQIGESEVFSEYDLTQHDPLCQSVLDITFPSNGNPTLGLPRSVVPNDSELERYAHLVETSIPDHMVAPISDNLVKGTHRNISKQLIGNFRGVLKLLDEVRMGSILSGC